MDANNSEQNKELSDSKQEQIDTNMILYQFEIIKTLKYLSNIQKNIKI